MNLSLESALKPKVINQQSVQSKAEKHSKFASFTDRLFADFIDGVIAFIIALPFWFLLDKLIFNIGFFEAYDHTRGKLAITNLVLVVVFLYNTTFLVGKHGQSWGRKLTDIKVVDKLGNPIGFRKSLFRNFLALGLSASFFYFGFLWMLWNKERQTWHDLIMKTYVIRIENDDQPNA